jgi:ubiquinone/menaquinone biosynthesis C-methylase UbiE
LDQEHGGHYGYALRYAWLTSVYDPVVRWTCRETKFKAELVRQAGLSPGDLVLDLACGTATLTILMKESCPGADIIGLDGSEQILETARKKAAGAGVELSFFQALSYEMPFEDARFDRVVSSLLFHHLNRDHKQLTLEDVYRVLKPGGELHVADWGKAPNAFFRAAFGVVQLLDGFVTTRDSIAGMLPDYMEKAGFNQVAETSRVLTPLGSVSLYKAVKPANTA